ncbi:MAG: hypothetical protein V1773_07065 [bacterium]
MKRYFKYVLNEELNSINENVLTIEDELINIFVLEEEKDLQELLLIISKLKKYRVILLGYNQDSIINLLDDKPLKFIFEDAINGNIQSNLHFSREELKVRLTNFFKGHGNESIFKVLNIVIYGLQNYEYYNLGGIEENDYKNFFIIPCTTNWLEFVIRYNKYKIYLLCLGYNKEISEIDKVVVNLDLFIRGINKLLEKNRRDYTNISERVKINLGILKKIDYYLNKISNDLGLMDAPIQSTNS